MSDELHALENAKSEALAAFAAIATIIDISDEQSKLANAAMINSLRTDAERHLSVALAVIGRGKGGNG